MSHVHKRREKTQGEEEEEWRGETEQGVGPHLSLPASAAAQVYRGLVSHQVSVPLREEEQTKGRGNHIQVVDKRQKKKTRVT